MTDDQIDLARRPRPPTRGGDTMTDLIRCHVSAGSPPPGAMRVLLAIDNTPARYRHLARKLDRHKVVVVVVHDPDAANILLDSGSVFAVMLDHDMPEWDGQHYAREVLGPRSVPVCVSSANHAGAKAISTILTEFAVPHTIISVMETAADERWLGWLLELLYGVDAVPADPVSRR